VSCSEAMVDPDRHPLSGMTEIDETNVPFRRKDEPEGGGQGRSPIGKIFMIGAVEIQAGKYPAMTPDVEVDLRTRN